MLHAAFMQADPKSEKRLSAQAAFLLLGFARVKATRKHVGEIETRMTLKMANLMSRKA